MATVKGTSQVSRWRARLKRLWKEHLKSFLSDHQWIIIGCLWVVAFFLGYVGAKKHLALQGEARSALDPYYRALQLFVMDDSMIVLGPNLPWQLELARFLAPVVAAYTAVIALIAIFHEKYQGFRLRFIRDHVVVCGIGRKGLLLTRGFIERGNKVVAIEKDETNSFLEPCREMGAIVVIGDGRSREILRKAAVHGARHLFSVCGDDGTNAEIAVHARELAVGRSAKALTSFIHIVDPTLCSLLQQGELAVDPIGSFRLEFFNVFDSGARALLKQYPPFEKVKKDEDRLPHILVIGLGQMGRSLVLHTARDWWTARKGSGEQLQVSIVDKAANRELDRFCLQHPQLDTCCRFKVYELDVNGPEFLKTAFFQGGDGDVTAAYICLDNDSLGLTVGLMLLQQSRTGKVPIVVRMTHDAGLAKLLQWVGDTAGTFAGLHPFGLLDRTCRPNLILGSTHEVIAQAIHEAYVHHQEELGHTPETNPSMAPWHELPDSLKESNYNQADHVFVKLQAVGCGLAPLTDWNADQFEFTEEEVERLAEMEHQRFVEERVRAGWKPGTKDVERKTSPHLGPWEQLQEEIKDYDRNTVRELPSFLAKAGLQIERR